MLVGKLQKLTFKQDTFERDFVVMNIKARKTKVEKDFYKLLNNSNFGNDCRNNIGNYTLDLLFDGLDEISYIKKFTNILKDAQYREFFSVDLFKEQYRQEYKEKIEKLDKNDPFYFLICESLSKKLEEDLEGIEQYSKKINKRKFRQQQAKVDKIENKIKECDDIRKNKMIIEFNEQKSASVRSIAVKSNHFVKCTMRFMYGKLLMFAKLSLKSFICSLVKLLHFPEENPIVSDIYKKYQIEEIHCYQVLTDTDSTSTQFIIVSEPESKFPECDIRDILFEIFSKQRLIFAKDLTNPTSFGKNLMFIVHKIKKY